MLLANEGGDQREYVFDRMYDQAFERALSLNQSLLHSHHLSQSSYCSFA